MQKIIDGTYTDYVFLFAEGRTAYSDLSVKGALNSGGKLYMKIDQVPEYFEGKVKEYFGL